ncbi:MAG: PaaX family transcriptional regulator C-terminal domain-containing protein [Euryarchaeota archaeon]|nr:PaaX family transcriptional regulator C-terminal domain-containing protein [Euryarchaeota archaeon]
MVSLDKAILCLLLREGEVPVERLLKILRNFKESEASVRTALSRLKKGEFVESRKSGKKASYSLTDLGKDTITLKEYKLLMRDRNWDGLWHIVTFDIPERFRYNRDILRKTLLSLGYGTLHSSVMISPYNRGDEIKETVSEYGIEDYVEFFTAKYESNRDIKELVPKIWDLKWFDRQYKKFISIYKHELEELKKKVEEGDGIDPSYAFLKRIELNDYFSRIISIDPHLPWKLLPDDWIGFEAERVCDEYLQFLENFEKEK